MKTIIRYTAVVLIFAGLFSCEIFEPVDENRLSTEYISTDPASAEGLLMRAYQNLMKGDNFTEGATDDAVFNDINNGYKKMATGELAADKNNTSRWGMYNSILYLNKFIGIVDAGTVTWHRDPEVNSLFSERLKGEALALRGLFHFYILQAHAGVGEESGDLLGVPYLHEFISSDENFNLPRLSFKATVEEIIKDLDEAVTLLPFDYSDNQSDQLPKYSSMDFGKYKIVNGAQYNLRVSGRIVKALKARLALFAASPSYLNGDGFYEMAAELASELINLKGGLSSLPSDGVEFYNQDNDVDNEDILWRGSIDNNASGLEKAHFPPSQNGRGLLNPSQNLVDAFPMLNGFPAEEQYGYDPQDPYSSRDPRLEKYIVVNGSSISGGTINTGFGGQIDRVDSIIGKSTKTGYYLRKLLRPDVRINNNGSASGKKHFHAFIRYTELYLILAEAANEIDGPDHKVGGMSARSVLGAIRARAGILQPDFYIETIADATEMRKLLQNERRLELCFEGFRFWDIRRWGLPLNETVKGYFYNGTQYDLLPTVEKRDYPNYGKYMPLPYGEVLRYSELEQNNGW